ncbi:helix-turn-helix transcriptional regulator [Plantactinospora sp. KLBMP9567]|uniref:helix-turn-helix domain-containing protein n=1 Tax=Plantactinospora sp. KLBMP9567 TaxID=3085900 RepID=UPI00298216BF|nr:helix-turn-helix transcriptional regulator [Plantactinospora sp. KLBMP9567]MDW5325066.1 helix-turn-helix transcriptional regulator [Plantactinospora sp. KLBMP9567]MDW5329267.1 helix-turn-helix transcriptional regulator [Plantactinospora sp. KLBMP9567]
MEHEDDFAFIRDQLRRQRALRGQSQEEFGKRTNYSASTVSAVETGTRAIDMPYATRADEILETGGLFVRLLKAAQRDSEPTWFRPWLDAERAAMQLRYYHPTLIPGLLQTENYARAVLRFDATRPEEEVEKLVASRLQRQEILTRDQPPLVIVVLDESALRRRDAIMAEQLAHLLRMAERPYIQLHIIPDDAGLHVGLSGPLALARSADGGWVGDLENQLAGLVVDDEESIATLLARWESVRGVALPQNLSLALLKKVESQHAPQ